MLKTTFILFYCTTLLVNHALALQGTPLNVWKGKWFPQQPGFPEDSNELVDYEVKAADPVPVDDGAMTQMGVPADKCDDAKTNLTIDWDYSPVNYTCFDDKKNFLPNADVNPILHCDHIPISYNAPHICMSSSLEYDEIIPTFGPHRNLWPKYGEYKFLPRQRWVHNLEHGAVVMLYHPCANKNEVLLLKKLVQKCLYRHIITPYNLLSPDRPLVLVTWGCRFMISKVDPKLVVEFIKTGALNGPEFLSKDGQFDDGLIKHAEIISNVDDSSLCPDF